MDEQPGEEAATTPRPLLVLVRHDADGAHPQVPYLPPAERQEEEQEMSDRVLIRFNTKFEEDALKREWRVLVNGEESLARKVFIEVTSETVTERIATGEVKYHFQCYGKVKWQKHVATVTE